MDQGGVVHRRRVGPSPTAGARSPHRGRRRDVSAAKHLHRSMSPQPGPRSRLRSAALRHPSQAGSRLPTINPRYVRRWARSSVRDWARSRVRRHQAQITVLGPRT
ncbi:protein of unknown function [Streptomyces murinus]